MTRPGWVYLAVASSLAALVALAVAWPGPPVRAEAEGRLKSTAVLPAPAGFDRALEEASRIVGLQSILAQREGEVVMEGYFGNGDPDRLFHLRSATKSVTSLLVGIALDQGYLASVDQSLGEILGVRVERFGPAKAALTVRHLLTMTAGLEWEELGDVDEYNRFRVSGDPLAHYLERPFVAEPGQTWAYSSGASHLLSVVVGEVTGMKMDEYAERVLFEPLEIDDFRWERHTDGQTNGAAGLELKARDSLKIGQLILGRGAWSDRRVVSEEWIETSTRTQVVADSGGHYGYQWWIDRSTPVVVVAALGFAGQMITVVPEKQAIVVTHCRWRDRARPAAEQSQEVRRFVGDRLAPLLAPELVDVTAGSSGRP